MNDMNGPGNTGQREKVPLPVQGLEVRVYPQAQRNEKDHLLAFASVTLGGVFAVNGLRRMNSEKGPFVAMPSKADGKGGYRDICFPVTKEMHDALNKAVLSGYHQALEQMSSRGAEVEASVRDALHTAQGKTEGLRPEQTQHRTADKGAR